MRGGGGGDRDQPAGPIVVDDDPKGTLRLEGQVVDEADRPVGGATVVLSSNPPRSATTEADGGFAFDALVGRPYTLVARAAQGVAGPVTARLTAKSDPVVLHLRPGAKISVTVTSSKGEPLDGATVELRGTDVQRATTKDGEVTFAPVVPGGYQVAAWAEGLARASEYTQARKGEVKVKLVLFAGAPVSGRVVDSDGKGVSTARVSYRAASSLGGRGDARYDSVATGPDGSFRFDALPAGSFRFTAAHPQYAPGSSALVTLDGKASKDGVLITLDAGATVRGHVYDAEHKPIASASVRIGVAQGGRRGGGGGFEPPRQAFSDDQGAFEIHGLPKRELEAVATHESGASHGKAIDASGGDVSDVELVIDVVGTISGVVVDPDGNAIEGAQVTAFPSMRGGDFAELRLRGPAQELTDGAGRFTLTGLSPGSYTLDASRSRTGGFGGFGGRGRRGASDGVTAETGAKDVKLVLQPEGGVKGKVVMTDGSVPTAFTVQIGATQQAFSGDSAFELDGIAPAQYGLSVRGPMFLAHSQDVLIEPGKIVDVGTIQVEQGRALAGIVVAGGQPVPNATVYAGRQVLGDGSTSSVQLGAL
ncbi:MAG TPA: carboxypeptidase-like regulatory domain-containing protein, partial [Kofleriaceae bacterium]|nr:carboxypeptidase-like regulatory domain-containing protein [Kofleriaceae bacterium]